MGSSKYKEWKIPGTIKEIEDEHDLWSREIDDINYWERVRGHIRSHKGLEEKGKNEARIGFLADLKDISQKLWFLIKNSVVKNPFFADKTEILFFGQRRKVVGDNIAEDIYCDIVASEIERKTLIAELPHNGKYFEPVEDLETTNLGLISYLSHALVASGLFDTEIPQSERSFLENVEKELKNETELDIDLAKIVSNNLSRRKAELFMYKIFLSRVDPEIMVIANTSVGKENLVNACKDKDIPVVELQHGAIHEYSLNYSYPSKKVKTNFPDYYFTWSSYWKNKISFPINDDKVIPTGFPYHDRESSKYQSDNQKQILFVSQPVIAEELARFAAEFSELDHEYRILYKLHPEEDNWKEKFPELANSDVEVIKDQKPLYKLFSESKAQVGVFSTTLFEASSFDILTYIVNLEGSDIMKDVVNSGQAELVDRPNDLLEKINDPDQSRMDEERYFKSNALENTLDNLNQIIEEQKDSDSR